MIEELMPSSTGSISEESLLMRKAKKLGIWLMVVTLIGLCLILKQILSGLGLITSEDSIRIISQVD